MSVRVTSFHGTKNGGMIAIEVDAVPSDHIFRVADGELTLETPSDVAHFIANRDENGASDFTYLEAIGHEFNPEHFPAKVYTQPLSAQLTVAGIPPRAADLAARVGKLRGKMKLEAFRLVRVVEFPARKGSGAAADGHRFQVEDASVSNGLNFSLRCTDAHSSNAVRAFGSNHVYALIGPPAKPWLQLCNSEPAGGEPYIGLLSVFSATREVVRFSLPAERYDLLSDAKLVAFRLERVGMVEKTIEIDLSTLPR